MARGAVTVGDGATVVLDVIEGEAVAAVLEQERLPASYRQALREHIAPVAAHVLERLHHADRPLLVGINGCQGSGKSTLARFFAVILREAGAYQCPEVSIDDLYHTRARRESLAAEIHPLLGTRGVPGTHDLALGTAVIDALLDAARERPVAIPRFHKSVDDRAPEDEWTNWQGAAHAVLFEGWCVACTPQADEDLGAALNPLEASEDPQEVWRRYVNESLTHAYQALFARIDYLVFLQAPSFECVHDWRRKQEHKLAERLRADTAPAEAFSRVMSDEQLDRFIQHYERLTRHMLATLPRKADAVISLAANHALVAHELRSAGRR
ncbi:MAG: hypothetical protein AAFX85_08015 [Pseudomonadota bacterium]